MVIRLKYFGQIAEIVGRTEEQVQTNLQTLNDLLYSISKSFPEVEEVLFAVFVNNKKIEDLSSTISENDEICLMPPFAGG